jgi:hypothetical protein
VTERNPTLFLFLENCSNYENIYLFSKKKKLGLRNFCVENLETKIGLLLHKNIVDFIFFPESKLKKLFKSKFSES